MTHRILIIDGHPDPKGTHFVHELADYYRQGAKGGRRPAKLLKGRTARLVITKGMPELFDQVDRSEHSIRNLATDVLGLCGIHPVRTKVLEGSDTMTSVEIDKARYDMRRLGALAR